MEYKIEKKNSPGWGEVNVLGPTYEAGKPEGQDVGKWRQKLESRQDRLRYLQTAERYWFGKDWFGSEKRKNPA
jgi:hypothetical protein